MATGVAATIVWTLPAPLARGLLITALLGALALEWARLQREEVQRHFENAVGPLLREHETRHLTGATTLAAGFTIAVTLTPPHAAALGILTGGLADAVAAIVGRRYGHHRFWENKSIQGSTACFITTLTIAALTPETHTTSALMIAAGLTLIEAAPLPIDDNITLPTAAALGYTLVSSTSLL